MSAHTPGPWETDEADHDAPYQDIKIKAARRTVCTVWIDDAPCHDFNAEQDANARLIASAPDLLKALRFILAFYEPGQTYLDTNAWKCAEASGRAAIAKATGEAA